MATGRTPLKGARLSIKRGCWATVTLHTPKAPEMHLAIAYTGRTNPASHDQEGVKVLHE